MMRSKNCLLDVWKKTKMVKQTMREEIEFILLCSTSDLEDESKNHAKELISRPFFDWDYFYEMSVTFAVLPLIYGHLRDQFKQYVPDLMLKKCHYFFMANAARNMVLTNELLKILDLLNTRSILAVPFKGPVLADVVYGSDSLRIFSDIDILVQTSEAVSALKVLQGAGYRLVDNLDEKYADFYVEIEHAFNLQSPDGKINIDLQWKLLGIYTPEPLTLEKFKDRLIDVKFAGKDIAHLACEDLLFYLCVHGTKDGWKKFEWICCIAELLRKYPNLDWDRIIHTAEKESCVNKFMVGIYLAFTLCKAPLPESMEHKISKDGNLKSLSKPFMDIFFSNKSIVPDFTNNPRFSPIHLRVQDDIQNKLRFVLRQIFRPTAKEIRLWPVPVKLTFLYYIFRPVRLLWRIITYAIKKLLYLSKKNNIKDLK